MCLVLTDLLSKFEENEAFLKIFDEITHLNFEKISPQFVKLSTFNWLIDNSDYLISVKEENVKHAPEVVIRNLSDKDLLFFTVRLKMLWIKSGLSQAELAKAINVSPSARGMYKQGKLEPDFITFIAMCMKLQTTPDYILETEKRLKPNAIRFEELLDDFLENIRKNHRLLFDKHVMDKSTRENLEAAFLTTFEVVKKLANKKQKK